MSVIHKKQKIETDVTVDVTCNRCGNSCKDKDGKNYECSGISAVWGYNSPWDTEYWDADLCIDCSRELKEWIEAGGGQLDRAVVS